MDKDELAAAANDHKLSKAKAQQKEQEQFDRIRAMLEAKLESDIILVTIPAEKPITLRFNKLSSEELDVILSSQKGMGMAATAKQDATKVFKIVEAKSLDGLTAEYLLAGKGFSADVVAMIILALTSESVNPTKEYVEGLNKFR